MLHHHWRTAIFIIAVLFLRALLGFALVVARFAAVLAPVLLAAVLFAIPAEALNINSHPGSYPLHKAARDGDLATVVHLLTDHRVNVDARDYSGNDTPLHEAAYAGRTAIVSALLNAGANVNAREYRGLTPLHIAAFWGHSAIVSLLLADGADVNAKSDNDARPPAATPLHATSWDNGHLQAGERAIDISILIAAGGHWGEACTDGFFVNPAGPDTPCICPAGTHEETGGECRIICVAPSVRNASTNLCDCPAPNFGMDGADSPGECALPVDCTAPAIRNANTNLCDCPTPNVGANGADAPGNCAVPSPQVCEGLGWFYNESGECIPFLDCPSGAALNREANVCEYSTETCGGLSPPQFYSPTLSACAAHSDCVAAGDCELSSDICARADKVFNGAECECPAERPLEKPTGECVSDCGVLFHDAAANACVPFVSCGSNATLNRGANECECRRSLRYLRGNSCHSSCASGEVAILIYPRQYECKTPSVESCGELYPAKFYDSAEEECISFLECAAGGVLDRKTNTCEFSEESCGSANPPLLYDSSAGEAGECGARVYPCHGSAVRKADNSGCECPAGSFAHGNPSDGRWWQSSHSRDWRKSIPSTAICHSGHNPLAHNLQGGWRDALFADNPNAEIVAHFIAEHGQDPDENDELHEAVLRNHYPAAKLLIEGGADVDRKISQGYEQAAGCYDSEYSNHIRWCAPLHLAVDYGRAALITMLLQRGANPDRTNDDGDTPLHMAARKTDTADNAALISFLLDKGANPNTRNGDGWRPLDLAYHGGNAGTWQARRDIMAALITGGADWSDKCSGGAIPNENYRPSSAISDCVCPLHISERDSRGNCECPGHSHSQVNGLCLPKDSAQVDDELMEMQLELSRLRVELVSLNARLSLSAEMPREAVEEIAENAAETAREIKWRRDNFLALARADLAGAAPPPVARSDTAAECEMLGGKVNIHSATGTALCSGVDANGTFCLVDSDHAFPCRGLFRHVRICNDDHNRPALNPFFCGKKCGDGKNAAGKECR